MSSQAGRQFKEVFLIGYAVEQNACKTSIY
jgi:hypothetical protein